MSDEYSDLYRVLIELSKIEQLKATSYSTSKGGILTGAATVLIGLVLGIYGLLLGVIIGAAASAALARDFRPVWIMIRDLTYEQKEALLARVMDSFKNIGINDIARISTVLLSDGALRSIAIEEIMKYFKDELNLRVL